MKKHEGKIKSMKMLKQMSVLLVAVICVMFGMATPVLATEETSTVRDSAKDMGVSGIAVKEDGRMLLADITNQVIWERNASGTDYRVVAGTIGINGYKDGDATDTYFNEPWGIAPYLNGYLITDSGNGVLRYYNGETIRTYQAKNKVKFVRPTGIVAGANGEVYISDTGAHVVYKLTKDGKISVFAGEKKKAGAKIGEPANGLRLNEPTGLDFYNGKLFIADSGNHRVLKVSGKKVAVVAGAQKAVEGNKNGAVAKSKLSNPQGVKVYKGMVYIADTGNGAIKMVKVGKVSTLLKAFAENDGTAPVEPRAVAVKSRTLFVGDVFAKTMVKKKL